MDDDRSSYLGLDELGSLESAQLLALRELKGLDEAYSTTNRFSVGADRLQTCALAVLRDALSRGVDIDDLATALVKSNGSICSVVLSKTTDMRLAKLGARFRECCHSAMSLSR